MACNSVSVLSSLGLQTMPEPHVLEVTSNQGMTDNHGSLSRLTKTVPRRYLALLVFPHQLFEVWHDFQLVEKLKQGRVCVQFIQLLLLFSAFLNQFANIKRGIFTLAPNDPINYKL